MERGPVPPHERTWRHPSELAAQERLELRAVVAPRTTRVTALAAGTFGLIIVAALVLVVTPRDQRAPIAVSATTLQLGDFTSVAGAGLALPSSLGLDAADTGVLSAPIGITGPNGTGQAVATIPTTIPTAVTTITTVTTVTAVNSVTTVVSSELAITPTSITPVSVTPTTIAAILAALATPVGDGRYALVTTKSIGGQRSGTVSFRLRSGDTATGEIIFELNDTVVVAMPIWHTAHAIASEPPGHADMVTVMSDTPVDMAFGDIARADVPEGTPVIDGEGDLVGLCSKRDDGTTAVIDVAEVGDDLSDIPADTGPAPSQVPTTTATATMAPATMATANSR